MTNVEVVSIAKNFGAVPVLTDISTNFAEGSFTSLLGPSGSGKTTLLRIIAGFIVPDRGVVTIGGRDVTRVPVWARNIGMVFQSYALFPHMTVNENVAFGLTRRGIRGDALRGEVSRVLDLVRLPGFGERRPKELSGGQQQRVALARAIATKPSVLLLDEPLSALDRRLRQEMQIELIRIQKESGLTTIFVTHDQEEALTLSDRVAILDRGRIVQIGAPGEIYERPRTRFAAEFLGDTNFLSGTAIPGGIRLTDGSTVAVHGSMASIGTEVTVAVRPEKIRISHPTEPAPESERLNRVMATVTSMVFAGTALTYEATGSGLRFKVFAQNRGTAPHAPGTVVELAWSPIHTVPLEASA